MKFWPQSVEAPKTAETRYAFLVWKVPHTETLAGRLLNVSTKTILAEASESKKILNLVNLVIAKVVLIVMKRIEIFLIGNANQIVDVDIITCKIENLVSKAVHIISKIEACCFKAAKNSTRGR